MSTELGSAVVYQRSIILRLVTGWLAMPLMALMLLSVSNMDINMILLHAIIAGPFAIGLTTGSGLFVVPMALLSWVFLPLFTRNSNWAYALFAIWIGFGFLITRFIFDVFSV